jgi:hypothetical protein
MQMHLLPAFKRLLTAAGRRMSAGQVHQLQAALNYIRTGRWMEKHRFAVRTRVRDRHRVWATAIDQLKDQRVLYLEFGVARGDSIRWWSEHLLHPETRLHGFDSFEGLPEAAGPWTKGQFDTGGQVPVIDDARVQFFKGLFHETLPRYAPPAHDILVLNMDADLYSSTIYVLRCMRPLIRNGTFIYFDEINHPEHEQRAFEEFFQESGLAFRLVAADWSMAFSLFQCMR